MRYEMTGKEKRSLRKIARRLTIQSEYHAENITEYYKIMKKAARESFYEDNEATLHDFLLEQFQNSF